MTVEELIKQLQQVEDKSTFVYIDGYEGGYHDLEKITFSKIIRDKNIDPELFGPHEKYYETEISNNKQLLLSKGIIFERF